MINHTALPGDMPPLESLTSSSDSPSESLAQLLASESWMEPEAMEDATDKILGMNASLRVRYARLATLADRINTALAPLAACHKGCHHCCNLTTLIYRFEAVRLAEVSGRKMIEVPYRPEEEVTTWAAMRPRQQCPFVVEGCCSVYDDRPMICRLHHSLGSDPGRCLPLPTGEAQPRAMYDPDLVEMPYHLLVRMTRSKEPWGAITEFFPPRAE